jgi:hypothetical protein
MKKSLKDTYHKMSDKRKLCVEAKIIFALTKDQPQSVEQLCRNAKVDRSSFYRVRRLLINEGILKEIGTKYALSNFVELQSLWDRLQTDIKGVKGNLVKMNLHKASYVGRDKKTGWRMFRYDVIGKIEGFMILKNAVRLVSAVRPYGVYFSDEYDGVFLTKILLEWKDRLILDEGLFEVRDVEALLDGSDSIGFYVGKLAEVITSEDRSARVPSSSRISDSRDLTREFLISNLDCNNITKDDKFTKANYCIMYDNPDYSLVKEFSAPNDSVDGIFVIGIPNSEPVIDSDHTVIGYDEHVPVLVYTIDKVGVSGERLQGKMKFELRRVCDSDSARASSMHVYLERYGDGRTRIGSKTLYTTEFVFSFSRNARE